MLGGSRKRWIKLLICSALSACLAVGVRAGEKLSVEQLKAKIANTSVKERPRLCVQIAQLQMDETSRLYAASEDEPAKAALTDVVTYSELARDYAIETRKYEKQTEIAMRGITRKLTELSHGMGHDEAAPVVDAISHIQRVRDDLLAAMFPKGVK